MLVLDSVSRSFGSVVACDDVSLTVERGELLALLGPSGCGKTTLLRLLAGFERPDSGTITIDGRTVAGATWVPPERRAVGMVFQDYALFPHLDVAANVAYGLKGIPRGERPGRVAEALALVGLGDLGHRRPHELSGGQQQRVALARALAPGPSVVLLDEPWSAIDPKLRTSMRDELAGVLRRTGVTAVLVTHDQEEALALADRVALMHRGRIEQIAAPETLYHAPASRWAAEFVGAANVLPGTAEADGRVRTRLGAFTATGINGTKQVEILLRPERIRLRPVADGEATVTSREFRGHDLVYHLLLDDGTALCAHRPSDEAVELGARVELDIAPGPVPLLAH